MSRRSRRQCIRTVAFLLSLFVPFAQGTEPVSSLSASPPTLIFEGLFPGQPSEGKFELTNNDTSAIDILEVRRSCGCMDLQWPEAIEPGKTAPLTVHAGPRDSAGSYSTAILIRWKLRGAERDQILKLTIEQSVSAAVNTLPNRVEFGDIRFDAEPASASVAIERSNRTIDWDRVAPVRSSEGVSVEIQSVSEDRFVMNAKLDPKDLPEGPLNGSIQLAFFKGEKRIDATARIPFAARIVSTVTCIPEIIYFGPVAAGSTKVMNVEIVDSSGPLKLLEVKENKEGPVQLTGQTAATGSVSITAAISVPEKLDETRGSVEVLLAAPGRTVRKRLAWIAGIKP